MQDLCVCCTSFSRWSKDSDESGTGHVRQAAIAGGQAAWERVEAGSHLPGLGLQLPGQHPGSRERRDHTEAEDAGGVEEEAAGRTGHGVSPVEECGGSG